MTLQETNIHKKDKHLGIQVLRAWLCLLVIYNHVPQESTSHLANWMQQSFRLLCLMAVPCFVMISFYLNAPLFLQTQPATAKECTKKVKRLLIPFIGWTIVGFIVYLKKISVANILLQLIFGAVVNAPLYYLSITIYFVIVFCLLTCVNIKFRLLLLGLLTTFCFYIQHAGINYNIFSLFPESSRYTLGRFCELFPYAVAAIFLRQYFNITKCCKPDYQVDLRWFLIIMPVFVIGAVLHSILKPDGFGYQGIGLTLCVFAIFLLSLIQSNSKLGNIVPNIVLSISNISLGIFCCHYVLNKIIRSWFGSLKIYDIIVSIPFVYGLLLFLCSVLLCLKLKNSLDGRLKSFVS